MGTIPPAPSDSTRKSEVVVTDVRMPFGSMVVFMIKWAVAALPALLFLAAVGAVGRIALTGLLASRSFVPAASQQPAERSVDQGSLVSIDTSAPDVRARIDFSSNLNSQNQGKAGLLFSIAGNRDQVLVATSLDHRTATDLKALAEQLGSDPRLATLGFSEVKVADRDGNAYTYRLPR